MEKKNDLPIYELRIEENDESLVEVNFVSLVENPAIGRSFLAFQEDNESPIIQCANCNHNWKMSDGGKSIYKCHMCGFDNTPQKFAIQDEDERIISGPLMLADSPIYRNDERGEYYVTFSKDTIKQIAQKFFRKGYQNNVNLMHDDGQMLTGLTMFESFITDKNRGIKPMDSFADVPDGSWFGSFKVDNAGAWDLVKDGKVKGFSIEGVFNYRRQENIDEKTEKLWSQILEILKNVD
jgi:hypothetical protein